MLATSTPTTTTTDQRERDNITKNWPSLTHLKLGIVSQISEIKTSTESDFGKISEVTASLSEKDVDVSAMKHNLNTSYEKKDGNSSK